MLKITDMNGKVEMCKAINDLINEGRAEGLAEGRAEMLVEIYRDQHVTDDKILILLQDKCNLTENQALKYLNILN